MEEADLFVRMRRRACGAAICATALGLTLPIMHSAYAQTESYPSRPITLIVPFGAGSATDLLARVLAIGLSAQLGQNVIVDNKPGAGGSIGITAIARARADGYTIGMVGSGPLCLYPQVNDKVPYNPRQDFTPLINLAASPLVLVVPAQSEIKSLPDLLAQMKKRQLRYNSLGNGTALHLAGALLTQQTGAAADHIPYRSAGDALTALFSEQVDFSFLAAPMIVGSVRSGRLRAIGVTTPSPSPALPDVPSLGTLGLKDFDKTSPWFGLAGPAGIDAGVSGTLHKALTKAMAEPALQARLLEAGFIPMPLNSPVEFASFIGDQFRFWGNLVKVSGAKAE